jgi:hypothetical protein
MAEVFLEGNVEKYQHSAVSIQPSVRTFAGGG